MFYKKKPSMSVCKVIGAMLAVFGAVSAGVLVFKLWKKHVGCPCKKDAGYGDKDVCRGDKDTLGDNWYDLGLEDSLHVCGCQVPNDENDLKSDENSVVNSENRSVNIENAK